MNVVAVTEQTYGTKSNTLKKRVPRSPLVSSSAIAIDRMMEIGRPIINTILLSMDFQKY